MDTLNSEVQEVQEILTCDGETVDETVDEAAILSALKTISTVVSGLVHTVGEMKTRMITSDDLCGDLGVHPGGEMELPVATQDKMDTISALNDLQESTHGILDMVESLAAGLQMEGVDRIHVEQLRIILPEIAKDIQSSLKNSGYEGLDG